jgi:hypothetical protein
MQSDIILSVIMTHTVILSAVILSIIMLGFIIMSPFHKWKVLIKYVHCTACLIIVFKTIPLVNAKFIFRYLEIRIG